jgi:hypothetical protein
LKERFTVDPARVERYRAAAHGASAAARSATEDAFEAAEALGRLRNEVRRHQEMGLTRAERTEVRPDTAERIARAEAEVAKLRKAQAQAGERAQHAGRLWEAIEGRIGSRRGQSLVPLDASGGRIPA